MARPYYRAPPDDNTSQLFTLALPPPVHIPSTQTHTHKSLRGDSPRKRWKRGEVGERFTPRQTAGFCPVSVRPMFMGEGRVGVSCGGSGSKTGRDPFPPSSDPKQRAREGERERERFPKELRAETLDNSRCFPGAYRRRGPSGFVSCGCSCLRAKWTTVDLTLDLSSLSLPPFLVLLSPSAPALCLSVLLRHSSRRLPLSIISQKLS